MMGPKKLSDIRSELRAAFGMSDRELLAWFDGRMKELERQPKVSRTEVETLRMLLDALVKDAEVVPAEPKRRRPGPRSKSKR